MCKCHTVSCEDAVPAGVSLHHNIILATLKCWEEWAVDLSFGVNVDAKLRLILAEGEDFFQIIAMHQMAEKCTWKMEHTAKA